MGPLGHITAVRLEVHSGEVSHILKKGFRPLCNNKVSGIEFRGLFIDSHNTSAFIEEQIDSPETVVHPSVQYIHFAFRFNICFDCKLFFDDLKVSFDRFIYRIHTDTHEFIHGVGGQVIRSERGAVISSGPVVVSIESASDKISYKAHFRLCQGDEEGAFGIGDTVCCEGTLGCLYLNAGEEKRVDHFDGCEIIVLASGDHIGTGTAFGPPFGLSFSFEIGVPQYGLFMPGCNIQKRPC